MTSNIGSEFLASKSGALGFVAPGADGFGDEKALRDRVMGKLRENMRPEFINRIDEIVLFRKLDRDQLRDIVRLLLRATETRLTQREITLTVTDAAIEWIADHGYEPEFGARPLRRVIQREVDDRVADLLVNASVDDGGSVLVDAVDGELVVTAGIRMPQAA
jgi:ATP-dependent Clp protease ATP-binding subunit ClpC